MKSIASSLYPFRSFVVFVALAGCGNATQSLQTFPPSTSRTHLSNIGHRAASVRHPALVETLLHSFGKRADGVEPVGGLAYSNGKLYGTTSQGGSRRCVDYPMTGCGVVFSMTPSGHETVLYSFMGPKADGQSPLTDLIIVNGTFYGTTYYGGPDGAGTVFSVTPSGEEAVLHGFTGPPDGDLPGGLLNVKGTIYGTTGGGGAGEGTVYTITPSGSETVIYSFRAHKLHGEAPGTGPLLRLAGKFYGTTNEGGAYGMGGVFSLNTSGHEKLLHSFQGGSTDGAGAASGLVDANGTFYGTTTFGGASGDGTVYSITPSGAETILHSFTGTPDGSLPTSPLLNVNGTLYGTTFGGGTAGDGTVFSITPSGTETVLYSFVGSPNDGESPFSDLTYLRGRLYGTTERGGRHNKGTVFSITL